MATLKEEAQAYVPPQTENIANLEKVPVNIELKDDTAKDNEGKEFKYKYFEYQQKKYRVPGSVIGGIKSVLKKYPNTTHVTVDKEGTGMATRYTVMPYIPTGVENVE